MRNLSFDLAATQPVLSICDAIPFAPDESAGILSWTRPMANGLADILQLPGSANATDALFAVGNDNSLRIDKLSIFPNFKIGIAIPESGPLRRGAASTDHDLGPMVRGESIQITNVEFLTPIFGKNIPQNCGVAVCSK